MYKYKILKILKQKYENALIILKVLKEDANFSVQDIELLNCYLEFKKDDFFFINKISQKTYIDIHNNVSIRYTCEIIYDFKPKTITLYDAHIDPSSNFIIELEKMFYPIK